MLTEYLPILLLGALALGVALGGLLFSRLLGPRRPNPFKLASYESGVPPVGDARLRFPMRFYLVAMIAVVFEIALVFLFPWAVVFRDMLGEGRLILAEMLVFVGVLLVGYVHVWRKGGFEWR